MRKSERPFVMIRSYLVFSFLVLTLTAWGQGTDKTSVPLADNIKKIVSISCMPCHSSTGGMFSRLKLNFDEWADYSAEKQADRAKKIYKKVSKNDMPPKSVRENRPDIIPTTEQIGIIKKWADSLQNN
jgi:uncharacterized membrane protein